jgi:hypothetical protein
MFCYVDSLYRDVPGAAAGGGGDGASETSKEGGPYVLLTLVADAPNGLLAIQAPRPSNPATSFAWL